MGLPAFPVDASGAGSVSRGSEWTIKDKWASATPIENCFSGVLYPKLRSKSDSPKPEADRS